MKIILQKHKPNFQKQCNKISKYKSLMFGLIFLQSFFDPIGEGIALLEHARAGKYAPEGNCGKMDEYQYVDNHFDGGVDS